MISMTPNLLFGMQFIAHLSLIPMIMYGTPIQWLIAGFVYFLSGCLGMTMTYHRKLTHGSWNSPKWIEYIFSIFATIGLTGPAISWVAIHKKHHKYSDTPNDPHSPRHKGWIKAHFFSMYEPVELKYATHLIRERFYILQHKYYLVINLIYAAILYTIDPFAIVYAWLVPAMILWNGGSSIISYSHRNGYPHNDTVLALLVWGEGYHKTHHDSPRLSRFGRYDLGGIIIRFIEKVTKNDV